MAMEAELSPGDAIFIPMGWFHHVEALERFNVLVNYWWDEPS
jgi:quercetin dioxygenase-like cupin family protein